MNSATKQMMLVILVKKFQIFPSAEINPLSLSLKKNQFFY